MASPAGVNDTHVTNRCEGRACFVVRVLTICSQPESAEVGMCAEGMQPLYTQLCHAQLCMRAPVQHACFKSVCTAVRKRLHSCKVVDVSCKAHTTSTAGVSLLTCCFHGGNRCHCVAAHGCREREAACSHLTSWSGPAPESVGVSHCHSCCSPCLQHDNQSGTHCVWEGVQLHV